MPMSSPDCILNLRLILTGHISSFFNWSLPPKCLQTSQNQHVKIVTSLSTPQHTHRHAHAHTHMHAAEDGGTKQNKTCFSCCELCLAFKEPKSGTHSGFSRTTPVCMPPQVGSRTLTLLPSFLSLTWPGCHFCPSSLHRSTPSPPFSPLLASCAPSGLYPYLKPHCLKLLSSLLPFMTDPS